MIESFLHNQEFRRDGLPEQHITVHTSRREGHYFVSTLDEVREKKTTRGWLAALGFLAFFPSSLNGVSQDKPNTGRERQRQRQRQRMVHQISIRLEREAPLTHSPIAVELSWQKKIDVAISLIVMHH